jgi:hypothetical protein
VSASHFDEDALSIGNKVVHNRTTPSFLGKRSRFAEPMKIILVKIPKKIHGSNEVCPYCIATMLVESLGETIRVGCLFP